MAPLSCGWAHPNRCGLFESGATFSFRSPGRDLCHAGRDWRLDLCQSIPRHGRRRPVRFGPRQSHWHTEVGTQGRDTDRECNTSLGRSRGRHHLGDSCRVECFKERDAGRTRESASPLLAVTAATAVAQMLGLNIVYVDVPAGVTEMVNLIGLPQLTQLANPAIFGTAVALAVVASAESLLCATAVDKLHDGPQSDLNKELVAQGVGNSILGILGGLPLTGVIVRSTANLEQVDRRVGPLFFTVPGSLIMITALPWVLQLISVQLP